MQKNKIFFYAKKTWNLGLIETSKQLFIRFKKHWFAKRWHTAAIKKNTLNSWQIITKKQQWLLSFDEFFAQVKHNKIFDAIFLDQIFQSLLPKSYKNNDELLKLANLLTKNSFDILGSGQIKFDYTSIPWHADFKANKIPKSQPTPNWHFWPREEEKARFFSDIAISYPKIMSLNDYHPDIKVPWELSRMQHLFILGNAYHFTQNKQKEQYEKIFCNHVHDWLERNPFLIGTNWLSPMEVAIRSINLIWGFYFFKDSLSIPIAFWKKLTCSLYEHATYLEYNWENVGKPHNHYLANLLGYFYLTFFFEPFKRFKYKQKWCFQELIHEFNRQVLPDGTCYEGSTGYHQLVSEIFVHFYLLCRNSKNQKLTLDNNFEKKLKKILCFLKDCSNSKGNLLQIGDNDSGKIVTGLNLKSYTTEKTKETIRHYPNFGISIINKNDWHITFRHPTFSQKQPTGHFHQDQLA